jgi:hypothetical protein
VPADLPALTRLTEDVVTAMRATEAREAATRRRRRSAWRRGFPVGAILLALLVAGALALRVAPAQGGDLGGGTVAKACGAGAAGALVAGLAARRPGAAFRTVIAARPPAASLLAGAGGGALCRR